MTLRHFRIFLTICRTGGVTKAAKKLYLAQPAVSLALRELEEHYKVRLFDRINRKLYLTESGKRLKEYAEHIVEMFDELEEGVQTWEGESPLHIGCSMTIGTEVLPTLIQKFKQIHPQIEIVVQVKNSGIIERMLLENTLDFGLIESTPTEKSLICKPFLADELTTLCSPTHPLAEKKEITIQELAQQPLLMREPGSATRQIVDGVLTTHHLSVKPSWESSNSQALISAAAAGLGLVVLPRRLVRHQLQSGALCELSIHDVQFYRYFSAIYHRQKYLTAPAKDFLSLCYALTNTEENACSLFALLNN